MIKQIATLEKENAKLRTNFVETPPPTEDKNHWSNLLEDEKKCFALYRLGSQALYQIAGLLTPCIHYNPCVISQSVNSSDQLLMVLDYLRGTDITTISEYAKLPRKFAIVLIDKYLETTAETLFSDSVKSLGNLSEYNDDLCILSYKIFIKNAPSLGGLYLVVDTKTRKIRSYKLLQIFVERANLEWPGGGMKITQNHNVTRGVLETLRLYFPPMKYYKFQSLDSAKYFYIFISALWNIMLDS